MVDFVGAPFAWATKRVLNAKYEGTMVEIQ